MRIHRAIAPTIALLGTLAAATPVAGASSVLSGYGGPGQGNQAILGSALLNGGGTGGGGSGPPTGRGSGGASALTEDGVSSGPPTGRGIEAASALTEGGPSSAPGRAPRGSRPGTAHEGRREKPSGVSSSAYPVSERGGAAPASGTLGLSGQDVLFILLALLALALTGVLTRQLTVAPKASEARLTS